MAGLRKPVRRKDAMKPSTPLILFLVFFIILSLGLGIWGYYGYRGQEDLRSKAKDAKAAGNAGLLSAEYWQMVAYEARKATGDPALSADEDQTRKTLYEEFIKADGKFSQQPTKPVMEKWLKENRDRVGSSNFREKLAETEKNLKAAQAALNTTQTDLKAARDDFSKLDKAQKANFEKHKAAIAAGNKEALEAAKASTEEREKAFKTIVELQEKLAKESVDYTDKIGKLERLVRKREEELKTKVQQAFELRDANPGGLSANQHSLLLDISKGKALWDTALGKITQIDLRNGQVYINLGSDSRIKPEVTFNVFGANSSNLPEGKLKATIEVTRVIDRSSSVARITSLYDADGREIALNESPRGRLEREASNALKEGDLLYNLLWGTRVAIAGTVSYSDFLAKSPAEEMRQLDNFMFQLGRMGIAVDSYIDLNDGSIKGAIVPRTRFLIVASGYSVPKAKEGEDKDKVVLDRGAVVNQSMAAMRQVAIDNGLFIISLDNFLAVTGQRRTTEFRPSLPAAGTGLSGLIGPAAKTPEDKGGEIKDKEKQ